jgi:hypothetical protein
MRISGELLFKQNGEWITMNEGDSFEYDFSIDDF